MLLRIDQDHQRFRQIVKGRIREDLQRYVQQGEMIGRQGKNLISIPVPTVDLPSFRFDFRGQSGVGAGEGGVGEVLGQGQGEGGGEAGDGEGSHILEVDVSLEELLDLLAEALELPDIEEKGKRRFDTESRRYSSTNRTGPESLRHFRRTYREAMKRQIATGDYSATRPNVVPIRSDKRYRVSKSITQPTANAAVFYLMDVSGSMGDEQKELVRLESFWIDRWLARQYKGVERRFIIHDAVAREVDEDTFFRTRESGGTLISSAYTLAQEILSKHYPWDEWNLYLFQFSDGDNWAGEDTERCIAMLEKEFLPNVNLFGYGQVTSPYGSGQFLHQVEPLAARWDNLVISKIKDKNGILDSIKTFLGKGR